MPPVGQKAQEIVYLHYGVKNVTYIEEDVGHDFNTGYMLPGLKQIYVDLGYANNLEDFEEPVDDFEGKGRWTDFD